MIDKLEIRRAIAKQIEDARIACKTVNSQPEVIAARAKQYAAREAEKLANEEFNRVFRKYYPRDDEMTARILKQHPDLLQFSDVDSDVRWIVYCCVTGLPIFEGDRVYEHRIGDASYERFFVLADAVTVDPTLARPVVPALDEADDEDDDAEAIA
jgi:hypothetical protein